MNISINLFGSDGKCFVRRPVNKMLDRKYTKKTVKHSGGFLMIWGYFSVFGVITIFWVQGQQ